MKRRLEDTKQTVDRYIEDEVERRVKRWTYIFSVIGLGIVFFVGLFGRELLVDYISGKVKAATSPIIIEEIAVSLKEIRDQAEADSFFVNSAVHETESNSLYLVHSSSNILLNFSNLIGLYTKDVSNYQSQVITNGEEFLGRLAILRSSNNVFTVSDLMSLYHIQHITNFTYAGFSGGRGQPVQMIELDHEPYPTSVHVRIVIGTNATEASMRAKPATQYGGISGQKLFITNNTGLLLSRITNGRGFVTLEYLKQPHFKPTP